GRRAFPCRDATAGPLDDRNERDDVVGLEAGLDEKVSVPSGQQAIAVAITAVARETRARGDFEEPLAIALVEQTGAGRGEDGVLDLAAGTRANAPRATVRRPPVAGGAARPYALPGEGLVHHAEQRLIAVEETDER